MSQYIKLAGKPNLVKTRFLILSVFQILATATSDWFSQTATQTHSFSGNYLCNL